MSLNKYSRLNCIILHGCNLYAEKISNLQLPSDLVHVLNNKLDSLDQIYVEDIDIAHPLPTTRAKKVPPIIIKFVRSTQKMQFLLLKYKPGLCGSGMVITESLTQHRLTILKETLNTFGFRNAWSLDGCIYAY